MGLYRGTPVVFGEDPDDLPIFFPQPELSRRKKARQEPAKDEVDALQGQVSNLSETINTLREALDTTKGELTRTKEELNECKGTLDSYAGINTYPVLDPLFIPTPQLAVPAVKSEPQDDVAPANVEPRGIKRRRSLSSFTM